ncbi:MAG: hypothetical protein JO256_08750 [Alphaproteobacteria bacterium]|nr:hypothetical protein [Alphaproteobacteria bacterium]
MRPLPVLAVIRDAYSFTFTHLGAIIGLIWLPMVLATVGDFFVTLHYGGEMQQAIAAGNTAAAGPAALMQFGFFLVRLALYAMMYVPVAQLALGQRQGGAMVHFAFAAPEWRMFRALLGLVLLFLVAAVLLSLLAGRNASAALTPQMLLAEVAALLFLFGVIFIGVRMGFLVPAIVVAEEGPVLARAWLISAGSFWRLLGVILGALGPLALLVVVVAMVLIESALDPHAQQTAENLAAAASANLPLTAGLQFLVAPFLIGLSVGASVFSWKALSKTDVSA